MKRNISILLVCVGLVCVGLGGLLASPLMRTHAQSATADLSDTTALDTWTATGSLHEARQGHTATLLPNGRVLVVGGFGTTATSPPVSAELYDPATGTWTVTGSMQQFRYRLTAT